MTKPTRKMELAIESLRIGVERPHYDGQVVKIETFEHEVNVSEYSGQIFNALVTAEYVKGPVSYLQMWTVGPRGGVKTLVDNHYFI